MATVSSEPDTSASQSEILHFIKSTFGTLEGIPCNCLVENKPKKKKTNQNRYRGCCIVANG